VRRIVGSRGYGRARLVNGTLVMLLGVVLIARMFGAFGLRWSAVPAYVLGVAMILLGAFRYYEYHAARKNA
jgi:hypothetical protein